jgi:DNA-binding transcriptional ArsR family regulator
MRILEKAGLVEAKREGHWRWYRRNEKIDCGNDAGIEGTALAGNSGCAASRVPLVP